MPSRFRPANAVSGASLLVMAGCAAPTNAIPDVTYTTFACPDGLETVTEQGDGSRYRTHWLGGDPGDAVSCRSKNGKGVERHRLFGRWDMSSEQIGGTAEEKAGHRQAMAAFLSGQVSQVGFILRGQTGEQIAQHWHRAGSELLTIGGKDVPADRIHITYVYAGTGRSWYGDVWYAPRYAIFVKARGTFGAKQNESWAVVRISEPSPAP